MKKRRNYDQEFYEGRVINNWKVISKPYKRQDVKKPSKYVKAECMLCGEIHEVSASNMLAGISKSCYSCSMKSNTRENNGSWTGYKEIPGRFLSRLKNSAEKRGIDVDLTIEDVWDQYIKQNRKCALTGVDITFDRADERGNAESKYWQMKWTASVDRIDNDKGYTPDNIQMVHWKVNRMRNQFELDDYYKWCKLVVEHHESKVS